jgi:hypothetical protein
VSSLRPLNSRTLCSPNLALQEWTAEEDADVCVLPDKPRRPVQDAPRPLRASCQDGFTGDQGSAGDRGSQA